MATTTTRHPRRGGAESDTTPRKGDKGVPDDLKRRHDERPDQRSTADHMADEIDAAHEEGVKKGRAERPVSQAELTRAANATPAPKTSRLAVRKPGGIPSVAAPMFVELVLITADEFIAQRRPPLPSRLLVVLGIFGLLGMAQGDAADAAAAFGWGLVVATFYSTASPGQKSGGLRALQTIGNFVGGKYAVKGSLDQQALNPSGKVYPPNPDGTIIDPSGAVIASPGLGKIAGSIISGVNGTP